MRRVLVLLVLGMLATAGNAVAAPPSNDDFAGATAIPSLPFHDQPDLSEATGEPGEPQACVFLSRTVWYTYAPAEDGVIRVNASGGSFPTNVNVYRADVPGLGGLGFLGCTDWRGAVTLRVSARTTYYLQAGGIWDNPGTFDLTIEQPSPPPNDDFASATPIESVPFRAVVDGSAAGPEPGEPTPSCSWDGSPGPSHWYTFTPSESRSYSLYSIGLGLTTYVALYEGSTLDGLAPLECRVFGTRVTTRLEAGRTYAIQTGALSGGLGEVELVLEATPDPSASFWWGVGDPSTFDTVQFFDQSHDPVWAGWRSWHWDFGDGSTSSQPFPTHRWRADGEYTVALTVETVDGRTASTTRTISVRTHDVAIGVFDVPASGRPLRTKQITVGVSNRRYQENVTVQLYRSVPGGDFQLVGSSTQLVKVRAGYKTTPFVFSYTFTEEDAAAGKVTFKAVAVIEGARDAFPADNTVIAPATKVR